ncbi:MAG: hypothetical protein D3910_13825, partial [Candidatus Electrothrix sp. ATG2]|nr:hypothetical protein [Candidatus Electrothrix sp. ATG2]
NRLYTLCSAIEYAKRNRRKLVVDWSDGLYGEKGKNIFWEYFDIIDLPVSKEYPDNNKEITMYPNNQLLMNPGDIYDIYKFVPHLKFPGRFYPYTNFGKLSRIWHAWVKKEEKNTQSWRRIINNSFCEVGGSLKEGLKDDVVFFLDHRPEFDRSTLFQHIRLRSRLEDKIERLAAQMDLERETVGIHIRSSDKVPTRNISVLINIIKKRFCRYSIFLATDSRSVEEIFDNSTSLEVKKLDKTLSEMNRPLHKMQSNSARKKDILHESILDMWLLSRCNHLLYQGNSTFSNISRLLHAKGGMVEDWLGMEL